jgi:hypothetical protein
MLSPPDSAVKVFTGYPRMARLCHKWACRRRTTPADVIGSIHRESSACGRHATNSDRKVLKSYRWASHSLRFCELGWNSYNSKISKDNFTLPAPSGLNCTQSRSRPRFGGAMFVHSAPFEPRRNQIDPPSIPKGHKLKFALRTPGTSRSGSQIADNRASCPTNATGMRI